MVKNFTVVFILLLFSCCLLRGQNVFDATDAVVNYNPADPAGSVTNPTWSNNVMAKWVRTPRMSWSTANFKTYMWNGLAFRMRFPNNYNPANAAKYPVIVFFHGGGEIGPITDNEFQLLWGAQLFEQRINNGDWNGFLIFPQETAVGWSDYHFSKINGILDTLQKYNNSDPDRIISMGLSSGGYGAVAYSSMYPQRVAAALSSSPAQIGALNSAIPNFLHVPVWIANGGVDSNPDPYAVQAFNAAFRNAGGNIYQQFFSDNGHNTWTDMWNMQNATGAFISTGYWNSAHKAQPLVFYGNNQFCIGQPIAARMGITAGYYAYQWQLNGFTIAGAAGNEYTATQVGRYRVRFMREAGGSWSAWTPNPVLISTKTCATDTLYAEHFNFDKPYFSAAAYSTGNFSCMGGIITNGTNMFTQDAGGIQGGRFLVNYTKAGTGCTFTAGDEVWKIYNPVTVKPNTNYEFSFYTGNQNGSNPAQLAPVINGIPLASGYVQATGAGNASWKKFSFTWNSGTSTLADMGIINRSGVTNGNDFTIDDISFTAAAAVPVPGCTANLLPANGGSLATSTTAALSWSAAANAASYDVYLWVSGNALPSAPVANVSSTEYNALGLTAATKYAWFVVPKNINGAAAAGCSASQTSFLTAIAATPVPACVAGILPANGALLTTASSAVLTWAPSLSAASYEVYLWQGSAQPSAARALVTGTVYNATGLNPGTVYSWYIIPRNAAGAAAGCSSNKYIFTTANAPFAPGCAVNLLPLNGSVIPYAGSANLSWTAVPNASSYDVYAWNGNIAPVTTTATVNTNFYNLAGLVPSTSYHWYVVPRNATGAAAGCNTLVTGFTTSSGSTTGNGTGLRGDYFNKSHPNANIIFSRIDPVVDFNWGSNSPSLQLNADKFSVRWTGYVQPMHTAIYTFYTYTDEGVRLWINGHKIIDNWKKHAATENHGSIALVKGVKYDVKMEYYDKKGPAVARLLWSSASTPKTVIPQSQLYPPIVIRHKFPHTKPHGEYNDDYDEEKDENDDGRLGLDLLQNTFFVNGLYPNPVSGGQNITLQLQSDKAGMAAVQIMSSTGNVLQTEKFNVQPGLNNKVLQTGKLKTGLYIIYVTGNLNKLTIFKLVVL